MKVINESLNEFDDSFKTLKNVIYLPIQIKKIVLNVLIFKRDNSKYFKENDEIDQIENSRMRLKKHEKLL